MPESETGEPAISAGGSPVAPALVADTIADPIISQLPADWRIDRDVPCPVCRYNLRGRREARCPECGATFRWQALLHVSCVRCGESLAMHQGDDCPRCDLPLHWPPCWPLAVAPPSVVTCPASLVGLVAIHPWGGWSREKDLKPGRKRVSHLRS